MVLILGFSSQKRPLTEMMRIGEEKDKGSRRQIMYHCQPVKRFRIFSTHKVNLLHLL